MKEAEKEAPEGFSTSDPGMLAAIMHDGTFLFDRPARHHWLYRLDRQSSTWIIF